MRRSLDSLRSLGMTTLPIQLTVFNQLTKTDNLNWCLSYWRGSALGFPRGEAVAKIGSSEPILVTDEEWRNLPITSAVRKKAPYWNTVCPLEAHMFLHLPPFLIHRFAVPLPPGGRYLLSASGFQTPIYHTVFFRNVKEIIMEQKFILAWADAR